MANKNLSRFQNGMIYALSSMEWVNSNPIRIMTEYFDLVGSRLVPKNPDAWNISRSQMNNIEWSPSTLRTDILNNYYYSSRGVTLQMIDGKICHPSLTSAAQGEKTYIPIFLRDIPISKIYIKYRFIGWTGAYKYWDVRFGYASSDLSISSTVVGKITEQYKVTRLENYGDDNIYTMEIDVLPGDNFDFLILGAVDGYLIFEEIGIK